MYALYQFSGAVPLERARFVEEVVHRHILGINFLKAGYNTARDPVQYRVRGIRLAPGASQNAPFTGGLWEEYRSTTFMICTSAAP